MDSKKKVKSLKSSLGDLKKDLISIKHDNEKIDIKEKYDSYIKAYKSKFNDYVENEEKKKYKNKNIHCFEYLKLINNMKSIEKFTKNLSDIVLNSLDNYNAFLMNNLPYYKQSASKYMINESQKLGYNFIFAKLDNNQITDIISQIKNQNLISFINRYYPSTIRVEKEDNFYDKISSIDMLSQYQLDKVEFNKFNEKKFNDIFYEDNLYDTRDSKAGEILFENSELTNINFSLISKKVNHFKIIDSKISSNIIDTINFDDLVSLTLDNDNLDSYSFQYVFKSLFNVSQIFNKLQLLSAKNNNITKILTTKDIDNLIINNKKLESLEILNLSNNNIINIETNFFKLVPKLKILDLYNNSIDSEKRCRFLMNLKTTMVILGRNIGIMKKSINRDYLDYYFKKITSNEYPIDSINLDSLYIADNWDKINNINYSQLKKNTNILEINLSSCNIDNEKMISILNKLLSLNNNIAKLNMSYNLLTEHIFELLVENNINMILHKLNVLDLSHNNINFIFKNKDGDNIIENNQLVKFLNNFKQIEKLYLKGTLIEEHINEFLKREVNNTQVKKKGKGGIMKFEPSDTEMKNIIEKKCLQINPKFKIYVNDLVTAKYTSKKRLKDIPNFESQIVFENQREEIKK